MKKFNLFDEIIVLEKESLLKAIDLNKEFGFLKVLHHFVSVVPKFVVYILTIIERKIGMIKYIDFAHEKIVI